MRKTIENIFRCICLVILLFYMIFNCIVICHVSTFFLPMILIEQLMTAECMCGQMHKCGKEVLKIYCSFIWLKTMFLSKKQKGVRIFDWHWHLIDSWHMIGHIIICLDRICILRVQNLYSSRTEFAKVHFLKTYKNRIIKHAKLNNYRKDRSILSISIIPYRVRSWFSIFVLRRYIAYILIAV